MELQVHPLPELPRPHRYVALLYVRHNTCTTFVLYLRMKHKNYIISIFLTLLILHRITREYQNVNHQTCSCNIYETYALPRHGKTLKDSTKNKKKNKHSNYKKTLRVRERTKNRLIINL